MVGLFLLTVGTSLPAQAQTSVIDIFSGNSFPQDFRSAGGTVFLEASDSFGGGDTYGDHLRTTDGSTTSFLQDTDGGFFSADWAAANGELFFTAEDGSNGEELWVSDGTQGGTQMVKDIYPGTSGSNPRDFVVYQSTVYFRAGKGNGNELWKSDGTSGNTTELTDINPNGGSFPDELTVFDDRIFMSANDDGANDNLWAYDPGSQTATRIKELISGLNGAPTGLTAVGNQLFFAGNTSSQGRELWVSNGTTSGTTVVEDIYPGWDSDPQKLTAFDGKLYFTAKDGSNGRELWVSDGTAGGTKMVKDINSGSTGSVPEKLTVVGTQLFFTADDGSHGRELWVTDGTTNGTQMVKDLTSAPPGLAQSPPTELTAFDGKLYFTVSTARYGNEVWATDGTDAGTELLKDVYPGTSSSRPADLFAHNNTLYFKARDGTHGHELWTSGGTTSTTHELSIVGTDGTGDSDDVGWRLLAPPSDATRGDFEDDLTFTVNSGDLMHTWDGSKWNPVTNSSTSVPRGKGFLVYVFDDSKDKVTSSGLPLDVPRGFSGDDLNADVTVGSLSDSDPFHLLGNPYDVAFDLGYLAGGDLPGKGFQSTVQIWDPTGSGQWTTITQGTNDDNIAAWQGFFVERQSTGSGNTSLKFDANGQQSTSGNLIGSKSEAAAGQRAQVELALSVEQSADTLAQDEVTLLFHEQAKSGWDGYEATQLPPPNAEAYATLSSPIRRGEELVHRALASEPFPTENGSGAHPVSVRSVGTAGTATLRWPETERDALSAEWTVELIDTETDSTVDLRASSYAFALEEGDGTVGNPEDARFELRVTPTTIPVELVGLEARRAEGAVRLAWQTASEADNAGFYVQRKREDARWQRLGFVESKATAGTTSEPNRYHFRDEGLPYAADSLVYRLRQVDTDGTAEVTGRAVVRLGAPEQLTLEPPFPNPASRQATLRFAVPAATEAEITVYDLLGRQVATPLSGRLEAGRHETLLPATTLAPGTYFVRLRAEGETRTQKLTVVR